MRLQKHLNERSFTPKDIPKKFRVAIYIGKDESKIDQLSSMKLKGLKGISDSGEIAFDFFGVGSDMLLIMDGQETVKLNKLTRIMYDNPHYFLDNNMAALKRIYNKRPDDVMGTWHNLADNIFRKLSEMGMISKYDMSANAPGQRVSYSKAVKKKVNTIKDVTKVFKDAMKEILADKKVGYYYSYMEQFINMNDRELQKIIMDAIKERIGTLYASEGEWLIKSDTFKIPSKTYLYSLTGFTNKELDDYKQGKSEPFQLMRYEKSMKEEIARREAITKKLNNKYVVKFVNAGEWDKIRTKHFTKKYDRMK